MTRALGSLPEPGTAIPSHLQGWRRGCCLAPRSWQDVADGSRGQKLQLDAQRCLAPWEVLPGSQEGGCELTAGGVLREHRLDDLGELSLQVLLLFSHNFTIIIPPRILSMVHGLPQPEPKTALLSLDPALGLPCFSALRTIWKAFPSKTVGWSGRGTFTQATLHRRAGGWGQTY